MARKKKSMIGFDPLAWLTDDDEGSASVDAVPDSNEEVKKITKKETVENKAAKKLVKEKASAVKAEKVKEETIDVLGQTLDLTALSKSYVLIQDSLDEIVADFYAELFSQHPAVVPLFDNTDEEDRVRKLSAALRVLFDNIKNEVILESVLKDLGERHQTYGAEADHYSAVVSILIESCKKHLGRSWTKKMSAAWEGLLSGVTETMLSAYGDEISDDVVEQADELDINESPAIEGDVLVLESVQDISKSEALKQNMLDLIKESKHIHIHASIVGRVDGSALQLLCGLFEHAKTHDIKLSWIEPSDALLASVEYAGVQELLDLDYFGLF